jgi:hypothetical protein
MLNNKKSFLQKARIAMVAIVTIMSIGGAYAMNAPKTQSGTTWGVTSTDGSNYVVTALGSNSHCNSGSQACEITSTTPPDSNGEIPMSKSTVSATGTFVK